MTTPSNLTIHSRGGVTLKLSRKIGEGAQASVYGVQKNGLESDFVAKVVKVAPPFKKGRKRTQEQTNHTSVTKEYQFYFNNGDLRQDGLIPSFPTGNLPKAGEAGSFYFLLLQKMESSLLEALQQSAKKCKNIYFGPIAERLLYTCRRFHDRGQILVDVKADNIMVAPASKKTQSLAERIRLLDFGQLVTRGNATGAIPSVLGTPLYASRATHRLEHPHFRDDVEAILIVMAELVIAVNAVWMGEDFRRKGQRPSYLPWADEANEEALGKHKLASLSDEVSDLYQCMPKNAAQAFFRAFAAVSSMKKNEPDYDGLVEMLDLDLKTTTTTNTSKKKKKRASSTQLDESSSEGNRSFDDGESVEAMEIDSSSEEELRPKAYDVQDSAMTKALANRDRRLVAAKPRKTASSKKKTSGSKTKEVKKTPMEKALALRDHRLTRSRAMEIDVSDQENDSA